ncbi:MAG: leucine-rich repeat domain-containing protein [Clostridia bacterium]|nr:leucine-rich repeat domain-containing protein [Clostridia bacterium]
MKKKLLMAFFLSGLVLICAIGLIACDSGGGNIDDPEPKHQHVYVDTLIKPTCTEQGYTLHKCSCGDEYKDNYVNATGHIYSTKWSFDSTYHWHQCTGKNCNETGDKTVHSYDNDICVCGAKKPSEGLLFSLNGDGQSYAVAGIGACVDKDLVIPAIYNGKPVTQIAEKAFMFCTSIKSVIIPNSIISIESEAFESCGLSDVTISEGVKFIGSFAFCGNNLLTTITLPKSIQSIGMAAFSGCEKLIEVINKSNLIVEKGSSANGSIGFYALNIKTVGESDILNKDGYLFYTNDEVNYLLGYIGEETEIALPNDYNGQEYEIYQYAFFQNYTLTSVSIGEKVTSIGDCAFYKCSSLENIIIPNSVISIGSSTFYECSSLTSVTIPNSVTNIGWDVFSHCSSLKSVTLGNRVKSIGYNTFSYCSSLTSVIMPNSVTSIEDYAFVDCGALTSIEIPNSVTTIGTYSFIGCISLTNITVDEDNLTYKSIDGNLYSKDGKTLIRYAIGKIDDAFMFPSSVISIGEYAFSGCNNLICIEISDSITNIEPNAFSRCGKLQSVTLGSNVVRIGADAFWGCEKLIEVINKSRKKKKKGSYDFGAIGYYALNIKSDGISDIDNIGDYVFYTINDTNYLMFYFGNDKDLVLPDNYRGQDYEIYNNVFENCDFITSVDIGNGVTNIGYRAFFGCSSLIKVVIGSGLTNMGLDVFGSCCKLVEIINLSSVKIEKGSTHLDILSNDCALNIKTSNESEIQNNNDYLFYSVNNKNYLIGYVGHDKEVVLPSDYNGQKYEIWRYAFYNYTSLSSVTIPNSVEVIGDNAFNGCSSLSSVTILNGVEIIGDHAFSGCSSLSSVTIPNSVKTIGFRAFYNCSLLTSVNISEEITYIGYDAFDYCPKLKYYLYDNALYIGNDTNHYLILMKNVNDRITSCLINDNCKLINGRAFYISSLTSITIPKSVKYFCDEAFGSCENLSTVNYLGSIDSWCEIEFEGPTSNPLYYAQKLYINNELVTELNIGLATKISDNAFRGFDAITSVVIGGAVDNIGKHAFTDCGSLKYVTINDNVTNIGDFAFSYCDSMIEVSIIGKVKIIGAWAFEECRSLECVTISNNVESIGCGAFEKCISLTSILIPDSVTNMEHSVFSGCSSLKDVVLSKNIMAIDGCFCGCTSLTSIIIPEGVKSIGGSAFASCYNLKSIVIPDSVSFFDVYIFENCFIQNAVIPERAFKSIENPYLETLTITSWETNSWQSFSNCTSLVSVTVGENVKSIGSYAFKGCSSLRDVIIKEGVESIDYGAFYDCVSLINITIPNSIINIAEDVFYNCSSLKYNEYDNGLYLGNSDNPYLILVKAKNKDIVCCIVNENCRFIIDGAFNDCNSLQDIKIGNKVKCIGANAFNGCISLNNIKIPNSVEYIGDSAFYGCSSLLTIEISNSIVSIGFSAFWDCYSLKEVRYSGKLADWCKIEFSTESSNPLCNRSDLYINGKLVVELEISNVTKINDYAFYGCKSLTKVTIGNSVTSIGDYAFYLCDNLVNVTLSDSIMDIGKSPFYDCVHYNEYDNGLYLGNSDNPYLILVKAKNKDIVSCEINKNCRFIGNSAFEDCILLNNLIMAESVISIGDRAFENCSSLEKIEIPNNVVSVGECTFMNCISLKNVTIGDNVRYIGGSSFANCVALQQFAIPKSITKIGFAMFSNCSSLQSVSISDNLIEIEYDVFSDCSSLTSIIYSGTMAQWKAIEKHNSWKNNIPASCKVHCADDNINI